MLTPKSCDIIFRLFTSGIPLSDSHFATADLDMLIFSANCSCVNPASFLAFLSFSPNVISHVLRYKIFYSYRCFFRKSGYFFTSNVQLLIIILTAHASYGLSLSQNTGNTQETYCNKAVTLRNKPILYDIVQKITLILY